MEPLDCRPIRLGSSYSPVLFWVVMAFLKVILPIVAGAFLVLVFGPALGVIIILLSVIAFKLVFPKFDD